jgi:hypothetical protein
MGPGCHRRPRSRVETRLEEGNQFAEEIGIENGNELHGLVVVERLDELDIAGHPNAVDQREVVLITKRVEQGKDVVTWEFEHHDDRGVERIQLGSRSRCLADSRVDDNSIAIAASADN